MKAVISATTLSACSVPHIFKVTPLALLSLAASSKSFSFNPPTFFQNPNLLHPEPNIFVPKISISFSSSSVPDRCLQMETASRQRSGEIHVIVGRMFARKTTTLLRKVQSERGDGSFQVEPQKHTHLDKTLKGLCYSGRLAEAVGQLCHTGLEVHPDTYALLLQECIFSNEYKKGKRIHAQMIVVGFVLNEYLKTKLLILYAKSGYLGRAHILLDKLFEKSLVSWNAIIAGYVQKELEDVGLRLYHNMRQNGLMPDQYTFVSVFGACASLATLEHGKQAHGVMIKCQVVENVVVNSASWICTSNEVIYLMGIGYLIHLKIGMPLPGLL